MVELEATAATRRRTSTPLLVHNCLIRTTQACVRPQCKDMHDCCLENVPSVLRDLHRRHTGKSTGKSTQ